MFPNSGDFLHDFIKNLIDDLLILRSFWLTSANNAFNLSTLVWFGGPCSLGGATIKALFAWPTASTTCSRKLTCSRSFMMDEELSFLYFSSKIVTLGNHSKNYFTAPEKTVPRKNLGIFLKFCFTLTFFYQSIPIFAQD